MLKIGIINNKKLILLISIIFLTSFCLSISTTLGYGSAFINAETKTNGTYYEILDYYDDYAYYKVFCRNGDYVTVTVEVSYPAYDVDLDIYTNTQAWYDSSSSSSSTDTVYIYVYSMTHYFIRVERYDPSYGTIPFTLTISGATGTEIPGFEIITLLIGVISISGVIYFQLKRKKKLTL